VVGEGEYAILIMSFGRPMLRALVVVAALGQSACWSPHVATIQPKGPPRLIQSAIAVESVKPRSVVQSVDPDARTITVLSPGETAPRSYTVSPAIGALKSLKAGDKVKVKVLEELTVYVSRSDQVEARTVAGLPEYADARVLSLDRSYRLLTVRFPNGRDETFKVSLQVRLSEMEAGDEVSIRPVQAIALRRKG
jgi:Cu/Ag efflux protein CusF